MCFGNILGEKADLGRCSLIHGQHCTFLMLPVDIVEYSLIRIRWQDSPGRTNPGIHNLADLVRLPSKVATDLTDLNLIDHDYLGWSESGGLCFEERSNNQD